HTRSYGDWSSDVCSSDLDDLDFSRVMKNCVTDHCPTDASERVEVQTIRSHYQALLDNVVRATQPGGNVLVLGYPDILANPNLWRSEERRVGKEYTSRC